MIKFNSILLTDAQGNRIKILFGRKYGEIFEVIFFLFILILCVLLIVFNFRVDLHSLAKL